MTGIQVRGQIQTVLLIELMDLWPIIINADLEHLKLPAFVGVVESLNFRHFQNATRTPRAPKIQKDDFAAEIAQFNDPAALILDRKIWRLLADINDTRIAGIGGLLNDKKPR